MTRRPKKTPRIFVSTLTVPPRYYISSAWKNRSNGVVEITGEKYDVTDQVEAILRKVNEEAKGKGTR